MIMKKFIFIFPLTIFLLAFALYFILHSQNNRYMKIVSPMFEDNGEIPQQYTCEGENINPPLIFGEIPENTKSLLLIMDDPDAVSGLWTHWIVANIPPDTKEIPENSTPPGIETVNSSGKPGYMGPCPPNDPVHHYRFQLYALDTELDIKESTTRDELTNMIVDHEIAMAELVGLYQKTR